MPAPAEVADQIAALNEELRELGERKKAAASRCADETALLGAIAACERDIATGSSPGLRSIQRRAQKLIDRIDAHRASTDQMFDRVDRFNQSVHDEYGTEPEHLSTEEAMAQIAADDKLGELRRPMLKFRALLDEHVELRQRTNRAR